MAKYVTPDFDVTSYEIQERITVDYGDDTTWEGSTHLGEDN